MYCQDVGGGCLEVCVLYCAQELRADSGWRGYEVRVVQGGMGGLVCCWYRVP